MTRRTATDGTGWSVVRPAPARTRPAGQQLTDTRTPTRRAEPGSGTERTGDGAREPVRISPERPPSPQDKSFVGVDGEVVPQHVTHLVEIDPRAELAGLEQVAAQH